MNVVAKKPREIKHMIADEHSHQDQISSKSKQRPFDAARHGHRAEVLGIKLLLGHIIQWMHYIEASLDLVIFNHCCHISILRF